jgi:fructosamine-3-kinase
VAGPPQYSGLCNLEAPVPSEEIQSEPLSSQMAQPRQDNDDSAGEDRSDVGSDFDSDNGWDEDANNTINNWYSLFKQQSFIYQRILERNKKISDKLIDPIITVFAVNYNILNIFYKLTNDR